MTHIAKWLRILLASATVLLAVLLAWQCVDIYIDGSSPANIVADGVYISPVFSREIVGERLRPFILPGIIYVALAVFTGMISDNSVKRRRRKRMPKYSKAPDISPVKLNAVRGVMLAAAIVLIAAGIVNGGMCDVLIKAINICTECIGLG